MRDRSMIDVARGRALVNKTHVEARNLIANIVVNSQQFENKHETPKRRVHEVGVASSHFEQQLASLTQNVQNLATSVANISHSQAKPCRVCSMVGHMADMCPSLEEVVVMS